MRTINEILFSLSPPPVKVDISIAHQSVTVWHDFTTSTDTIQSLLEDAGFDVSGLNHSAFERVLSQRIPDTGAIPRRKHIQQCTMCQEAVTLDDALSPQKFPPDDGPHRITLSIGGMTCSSCPATITEMVSQLPGISEVVVNLLNHCATVVVARRELVGSVTETVDDCGYEVEVVNVEPFGPSTSNSNATTTAPRNLLLCVNGMYSQLR